jgi:hypothetical protein
MKLTAWILVASLVIPIGLLSPRSAEAQARHAAAEFGLGVSSVLLTIPYGIAKTAYAIVGTAVGGFAWCLTARERHQTARGIIQPAVRGDYVVVPEHLTLERPIIFFGRDPVEDPNPYQ